jgi:hypothetical protein
MDACLYHEVECGAITIIPSLLYLDLAGTCFLPLPIDRTTRAMPNFEALEGRLVTFEDVTKPIYTYSLSSKK